MIGELLFQVEADWKITDFGQTPLGGRNNFELKGKVTGKIKGTFSGFDYGTGGANGVVVVHAHDSITASDGSNISMFREGFAIPNPKGTYDIKLFATFSTNSKELTWLNTTLAALEGEGNPKASPNLRLKAYDWKKA